MKKKMVLVATALLLATSTITGYAAGWGNDEVGYWYLLDSYTYARDQIVTIDGVNYGFNRQAYMAAGWLNLDSNWYYFNPESGAQVKGWVMDNGKWYYLNPNNKGIMHKSWLDDGGSRYYLDSTGAMLTGGYAVDGYFYYSEPDGKLRRGVTETEGGVTIRYDSDGKQWYKNSETALNKLASGDEWLPVLEASALTEQREVVKENIDDYIDSAQYDLYVNFKEQVSKTSTSKEKNNAIDKWKKKVATQLKKLSMEQEEIDDYVESVVRGLYNDDEGSWTYRYTEEDANGNTTSHSYTYRYSYSY